MHIFLRFGAKTRGLHQKYNGQSWAVAFRARLAHFWKSVGHCLVPSLRGKWSLANSCHRFGGALLHRIVVKRPCRVFSGESNQLQKTIAGNTFDRPNFFKKPQNVETYMGNTQLIFHLSRVNVFSSTFKKVSSKSMLSKEEMASTATIADPVLTLFFPGRNNFPSVCSVATHGLNEWLP